MNSAMALPEDERQTPLAAAMADWVRRHGGGPDVQTAMRQCVVALHEGHSCIALGKPGEDTAGLLAALHESPLVGLPGEAAPLVLDGDRLYLQRYRDYECRLAEGMRKLLAAPPQPVDIEPLLADGDLFDYSWLQPGDAHWQAVAAFTALRHRLAVVSGGPGTGKTYTVLRLLRLLIEAAIHAGNTPPQIRLAAPTGKAATRMLESIKLGLGELPASSQVLPHIPQEASTLHRLLGLGVGTTRVRHDRDNPLAADIVVVDEASMVDLPTMTRLIDALPEHARLILLGDRYQLASVESGSVLAELCNAAGVNSFSLAQQQAAGKLLPGELPVSQSPLADHVVTLQTSHRFKADSVIGRLAAAINQGDANTALELCNAEGTALVWHNHSEKDADDALLAQCTSHALRLARADTPESGLAMLGEHILLCALRRGPSGAVIFNQRITDALMDSTGSATRHWYPGRPVIVTRNDYRQDLYNGDIGICLPDHAGRLRVWFRQAGGIRSMLPSALPEHETAYALTIHKSQGSEFEQVAVVLPEDDNPLLTRELLYTGITRARHRINLIARESALRAAIARRTIRTSGLGERIRARPP